MEVRFGFHFFQLVSHLSLSLKINPNCSMTFGIVSIVMFCLIFSSVLTMLPNIDGLTLRGGVYSVLND